MWLSKKMQSQNIPYQDKLSKDAGDRYLQKLASINQSDP